MTGTVPVSKEALILTHAVAMQAALSIDRAMGLEEGWERLAQYYLGERAEALCSAIKELEEVGAGSTCGIEQSESFPDSSVSIWIRGLPYKFSRFVKLTVNQLGFIRAALEDAQQLVLEASAVPEAARVVSLRMRLTDCSRVLFNMLRGSGEKLDSAANVDHFGSAPWIETVPVSRFGAGGARLGLRQIRSPGSVEVSETLALSVAACARQLERCFEEVGYADWSKLRDFYEGERLGTSQAILKSLPTSIKTSVPAYSSVPELSRLARQSSLLRCRFRRSILLTRPEVAFLRDRIGGALELTELVIKPKENLCWDVARDMWYCRFIISQRLRARLSAMIKRVEVVNPQAGEDLPLSEISKGLEKTRAGATRRT